MPIYEYECTVCHAEFEARRPFSEALESAACPQCGGEGQRLISVFASPDASTLRVPAHGPMRKKAS